VATCTNSGTNLLNGNVKSMGGIGKDVHLNL
jgi:hypothetical protein